MTFISFLILKKVLVIDFSSKKTYIYRAINMKRSYTILTSISIDIADISIGSDGIMRIHIKIKNNFEIEDSIKIVEARTKLAEGKAYPILYTTEHSFITPSNEVKKYVSSPERSKLVTADAFIIKSLPQRLAAKIYYKFMSPIRPTAFFSNEEDAIAWLKQYV